MSTGVNFTWHLHWQKATAPRPTLLVHHHLTCLLRLLTSCSLVTSFHLRLNPSSENQVGQRPPYSSSSGVPFPSADGPSLFMYFPIYILKTAYSAQPQITSPLVLPQAKAPMLFGDYTLFLKGANLMSWATLFRKLYPSSLISFPSPPGNMHSVMGTTRAPFPIILTTENTSSQQTFHVLPYISRVPMPLAWDHCNSSGQSGQK